MSPWRPVCQQWRSGSRLLGNRPSPCCRPCSESSAICRRKRCGGSPATFYAQFYFEPPGKHRVTLCRGTACHVRGSGKLQDDLSRTHGLQPGETSPDGLFTLETVACFGACAQAPVLVVDDHVYRQQTTESMKELLGSLETAP